MSTFYFFLTGFGAREIGKPGRSYPFKPVDFKKRSERRKEGGATKVLPTIG